MRLYRIRSEGHLGQPFGYCLTSNYTRIIDWCENKNCPLKSITERVFPATIKFTGGRCGDLISDVNILVFKAIVATDLQSRFRALTIEEVLWESGSKPPTAVLESNACELFISASVPWNPELSTLNIQWKCDTCQRALYEVAGVALPAREEKHGERWEWVDAKPRTPGMGVIIPAAEVEGLDFFKYGNVFKLCTETAKTYIEAQGWTNITFQEYGETI